MNLRRRKLLMLAASGVVGLLLAHRSQAATYSWTGAADNDATNASNWAPGVPNYNDSSTPTILQFDSSASVTKVSPNLPANPPGGPSGQTYADIGQVLFAAGAPAETWTGTGYLHMSVGTLPGIMNNSSNTQTFNLDVGIYSTSNAVGNQQLNAAAGDIVINGLLHASSDDNRTTRFTTIGGSHNVFLHQIVANGTTATVGQTFVNGSGTVILADTNGSGSYAGNFIVRSTSGGVLRATNVNSLGSNVGSTSIEGGTTGNGAVELATGVGNAVTFGENFGFTTRTGTVANAPHLVNISGSNELTGSLAYATTTVGNNVNIESRGTAVGDLLKIDGAFNHTSTGSQNLVLSGAGNGEFAGAVTSSSGNWDIVKQGAGKWTLSNSGNTVNGTATVQGGTLSLGSTGTLVTGNVVVQNGGRFDVSGLSGGYSMTSTQSLKGAGTVVGNLTTGGAIAPGDSGAGSISISGNVSVTGGGTLSYELTNNPSGTNDDIEVGGNLSLSGVTTLAVAKLNSSLSNGSYQLIHYAGNLTGDQTNFSLAGALSGGTTRQAFAVNTSVNHLITLDVSGSAANLTWVGGLASNTWDLVTTANWTGAPGATPDNRFYNGDSTVFGDTGSNSPNINIVNGVGPQVVTFTNSTGHDYTLTGGSLNVGADLTVSGSGNVSFTNTDLVVGGNLVLSGSGATTIANSGSLGITGGITTSTGTLIVNRSADLTIANAISGGGVLVKQGANTLTITGNNTAFTGPVVISSGKVILGSDTALGTSAGSTTVSSGAQLDLNGANASSETVTIAGSGVDGNGALQSTSSISFGHVNGLVLSNDATIGVVAPSSANRAIIFVDGANASVNGNGHNLTAKMVGSPSNELDFLNVGETHLGNITIDGGDPNATHSGAALYIGGNTTLGDAPGVVTITNGAKMAFYAGNVLHTKPIVISSNGGGIEVDLRNNQTSPRTDTLEIASQVTLSDDFIVNVYRPIGTGQKIVLSGKLTGASPFGVHAQSDNSAQVGMVALTSDLNDYTADTTIGGGLAAVTSANDRITLSVGNGGATGKLGPGAVHDNGTLQFNKTGSYTISNFIDGPGAVSFVCPGATVKLTAANQYAGITVVTAGTAEFGQDSQLPVFLGFGADIQHGRVVLDYPTQENGASINQRLADAYHDTSNFASAGHQFRSSTATASTSGVGAKGLGMYDDGTSKITVAEAYYGDANLDLAVNALDFNTLATDYGMTGALWYQGDFNYDNTVNSLDFDSLAANFNLSLPTPAVALGALVPEPASLSLLAIAGFIIGRRRRK